MERVELRPFTLEGLHDRRDRKRRNQRIAAGVVGIAVFVTAIWIVTSVGSFDRSTPAVPGSETGRTETGPPPARASTAPDVVRQGECHFVTGGVAEQARSRLELTELVDSDSIKVRFEVHRSPVGHNWRIELRHAVGGAGLLTSRPPSVFFRGTRVASDSGDLVVQRRVPDREPGGFTAKAVETQAGQVCKVEARHL